MRIVTSLIQVKADSFSKSDKSAVMEGISDRDDIRVAETDEDMLTFEFRMMHSNAPPTSSADKPLR
jgi:hypothetical protein